MERQKREQEDLGDGSSNSVVSVSDMIPTPLQAQHIVKNLSGLSDNENYLIVYVDKVKF